MPAIALTPASLSFLTQFILALTILGFLIGRLRQCQDAQQLKLLVAFFLPITLFVGMLFLDTSFSPDLRFIVVCAENTVLAFALIFLYQFGYHFPKKYPKQKVARYLSFLLSSLYFLWEAGFTLYRYHALFSQGKVLYRPLPASYVNVAFLLWVPVIFLQQSILASSLRTHASYKNWAQKLWRPATSGARGARNFALIFIIIFLVGLFNLLLIFNLPHTVYYAAMSIGILLALWLFVHNYIQFLPGNVKTQSKLSILVLTVFLAFLGLLGWATAPPYIKTFRANLTEGRTLRFTPKNEDGYTLQEVAFFFEENREEENRHQDSFQTTFAFPFFGENYTDIYIRNFGAISLGENFLLPDMQAGKADVPMIVPLLIEIENDPYQPGEGQYTYHDVDTGRLIVTWEQVRALSHPDIRFSFQVILYENGMIDFNYKDIPPFIYDPDATPSANPWIRGILAGNGEVLHSNSNDLLLTAQADETPLIENYQLAFREHLHQFMLPLAKTILVGSLLLLTIVPLTLRYAISQPLVELVGNIHNATSETELRSTEDMPNNEIDYLNEAFTRLTAQINAAKENQTKGNLLPSEVEAALTERQIEVLEKILLGYTYKETGEALFISENTVRYHLRQILEKLGLKTKRELVRYVQENAQNEDYQ